eukprot:13954122-Alexandrium_andersonii.AAC.1
MSASLVGSEMCIRDSPLPPPAALRHAPAMATARASSLDCPRRSHGALGCLLYTSDAADDM